MDYEKKCKKIIEFFKLKNRVGCKKYNYDTFEGILEYYEDNSFLTSGQEKAIDNVIDKFKIK
jgi:hypothetical protein